MNVEPLRELAKDWRAEAELFAERGMDPQATMAKSYAAALEKRLDEWEAERLTLEEAAEESGYSYDRLQHLVADGRLPNAGEPGAPRIRRQDLPRKPRPTNRRSGGPDLAGQVLRARGVQ